MKKHIVIVMGLFLATGTAMSINGYTSTEWKCGNPVGCQGGPRDGKGPRNKGNRGNGCQVNRAGTKRGGYRCGPRDGQGQRRRDGSCNGNGRGYGRGEQCGPHDGRGNGPRDGRGGGCNRNNS